LLYHADFLYKYINIGACILSNIIDFPYGKETLPDGCPILYECGLAGGSEGL
jgi:hypothetical protein